jgi:hypothetical protein
MPGYASATADCWRGELVDCIATDAPIGELLSIKVLGDVRLAAYDESLLHRSSP